MLMLPMTIWGQTTVTAGPFTLTSAENLTENTDYSYTAGQNANDKVAGTLTIKSKTAITISMTTTTTDDRIHIDASCSGENAANITLNNVSIDLSGKGQYAGDNWGLHIPANAKANITLAGTNVLKGGSQRAGINVPENAELIITANSTGSLTAQGNNYGAGIGGNDNQKAGTITINGGMVTAISGSFEDPASIGGGSTGAYTSGAAGGTVTINGGIVSASYIGGGGGYKGKGNSGSFQINNGVVVCTNGIGDKSKQGQWNGIVFKKTVGTMYGTEVVFNHDFTIPDNTTLTINSGQTLTIKDCTLTLGEGAKLINNGGTVSLVNGGAINNQITYHANYGDPEETKVHYAGGKVTPPTNLFTRQYYTFKGWYADVTDETGGKITEVTTTKDLYAHWTPNTFTLNTLSVPTLTYGTAMQDITLSSLLPTDAVTNCGEITFSASGLPTGLTCNNGVISGTPAAASTDEGSKVTITTTAKNTSTATQEVTFKVNKALLTVTPKDNQILYAGEEPEFGHSGEANGETAAFEGKLKVNTGNNTIEQGDLKLKDNGSFRAANYELKMSSSVTCTYHSIEPKEAEATITASVSETPTKVDGIDWYKSSIALTAPEGFTIREKVENRSGSENELTITTEGIVLYILSRNGKDYEKTATFGIDLNAPTVSVQSNNLAFTLTATDGKGSGIASAQIDGADVTLTNDEYTGNASAGTHTYLVTDKVGRETEGSFTLTAYTPPPYVPSYYDIYLEPNDSVRLSTTGTTVEEGYSFTLTAEVAEGYDPATLVVEYRKGRSGSWQALKAESSGKYRIRSVYSDIYIRASVRPLGDPTALETVGDGKSHIRTGGGIVYIETPVPQRVTVFTLGGRLIRHENLPAGDSRLYGLPAGLYVIRLQDGTTVKGLVRR